MKSTWLRVVCMLCALTSVVRFSSTSTSKGDGLSKLKTVLMDSNSLDATQFSPAVESSPVSITNLVPFAGSKQPPFLANANAYISSLIISDSARGKTSTVVVASASKGTTVIPPVSKSQVTPATPSASIPPPVSYSPLSSVSSISHSLQHMTSGFTQPSISSTRTGCAQPVTVTVNGLYCSNTPSPIAACSNDCSAKIGLSLGISIPGTAIFTFLLTALSCLCCQRVKKKQSYIQLAPTVYFDEEEHD